MLVFSLLWMHAFASFVLVPPLHNYCLYGTSAILPCIRDENLLGRCFLFSFFQFWDRLLSGYVLLEFYFSNAWNQLDSS